MLLLSLVCYNVGVDVNGFYPVTLDHIMEEINAAKQGAAKRDYP